jgi:D-galactarolactone cycloisomerase
MKITAITTTLIGIPYDTGAPTQALAGQAWTRMAILLVRVDTDAGVTGWGEGFGHAVAEATKTTVDTLVAPHFIGRDPTDIASLMAEITQRVHLFGRNGSVTYALSAIDIALWDVAGKCAGLPLHRLLGGGGRRDLPAYASLLRYGAPAAVGEMAGRAAAQGYRAVKLHEIDVPQVKAAREAIGNDMALMCDTNCPWSFDQARHMARAFAPFALDWLEEPIWPPEDHAGLARLRSDGAVVAAGENASGLHDFRHMFEARALDVAQPSVTKIGGVTETMKVAALAEAFGVRLVPHCAYFGPGYLASLHIGAALPREAPFERLYLELEASPFGDRLAAAKGRVAVPQGPGLGCDPDPSVIDRYRVAPDRATR